MLTKNSIISGKAVADALNHDNKTLLIKEGTLIDELMKTSVELLTQSEVDGESVVELIEQSFTGEEDEKHDIILNNYVTDISSKVGKTFHHALNVVTKEIIRFYDKFLELNNPPEVRPSHLYYNLGFVKLPEVTDTEFFRDIIDTIKEDSVGFKRVPMNNLDSLIADANESIFTTGIGYVDDLLKSWLGESDNITGNLQTILKEFAKLSDGEIIHGSSKSYQMNSLEYALVPFFFFRHLSSLRNEEGESIKNLTVSAYNNFRFWTYICKKRFISYKNAIYKGLVINPCGTDKDLDQIDDLYKPEIPPKNIVIYSESLNKLQERRVDATAIYGYVLNGGNWFEMTFDELAVDRERYSNIWESRITTLETTRRNLTIANTRWCLNKAFVECFNESIQEGHEEGVFSNEDISVTLDYIGQTNSEELFKEVREYIDNLNPNETPILFNVCIDIIAGIRYKEYPIKDFLLDSADIDKHKFNITETKLRIAISRHVAKFLIENISVSEMSQ